MHLAVDHPHSFEKPTARRSSASISWAEVLMVVTVMAAGLALRAWNLSVVGVDHFDEGVYVFSALGMVDPDQPHRLYPQQIRFSPPVYFSLVAALTYLTGLQPDSAAVLVNLVLSVLTIPLLWWIGRTWFNVQAGVAAAVLLAFSEYHIAVTRTALTDVTFAFLLLVALGAVVAAYRKQTLGAAILAGLAVGLAWNTKYHGFFALVIYGLSLLPLIWSQRRDPASLVRPLGLWGVSAASALAAYLPWALFIQSQPGGYPALARYQRTLLSLNWPQNLLVQAQQQLYFEGHLSRIAPLVAFMALLFLTGRQGFRSGRPWLILLALGVSGLLLGTAGTALLAVVLLLPSHLNLRASHPWWVLLAWLGLWFFSTPLYHPYARLVLPFSLAAFLAAGYWMSLALPAPVGEPDTAQPGLPWGRAAAGMLGVLILGAVAFNLPVPSNPWRASQDMQTAAVEMQRYIDPGERVIVIGEPALAYYLHQAGRPAFERVEDLSELDALQAPAYLVTGVYSQRAPSLRIGIEALADRLIPLATYSVHPKDVRVVDDFPPGLARQYSLSPDDTFSVTLYQLLPPLTTP